MSPSVVEDGSKVIPLAPRRLSALCHGWLAAGARGQPWAAAGQLGLGCPFLRRQPSR